MDKLALYKHIEVIAKGNFGIVSKVQRIETGEIMCWKELNYESMSEKEKK